MQLAALAQADAQPDLSDISACETDLTA